VQKEGRRQVRSLCGTKRNRAEGYQRYLDTAYPQPDGRTRKPGTLFMFFAGGQASPPTASAGRSNSDRAGRAPVKTRLRVYLYYNQ